MKGLETLSQRIRNRRALLLPWREVFCAVAVLFVVSSRGSLAIAEVPLILHHQGRILDQSGLPLSGTQTLVFKIYNSKNSNQSLWTESQNISFQNGYYTVQLGINKPLAISLFTKNKEVYLGITVGANGQEMTPRIKLSSVPYALVAHTATNVSGGVVEAQEIRVGGKVIIDKKGTWKGPSTGLKGEKGDSCQIANITTGSPSPYTEVTFKCGQKSTTVKIPHGQAGPPGPPGPVGCTKANSLLKSDGKKATCSAVSEVKGSVGIGTDKPKAKLEINATQTGPGGWYKAIHFTRDAHSAITLTHPKNGGLLFGMHGKTQSFYWGYYHPDEKWSHYAMFLRKNGDLWLSGKLGLGIQVPKYKLDVRGKGLMLNLEAPASSDTAGLKFSRTGEVDSFSIYMENYKTPGKVTNFNRLVIESGTGGDQDYILFRQKNGSDVRDTLEVKYSYIRARYNLFVDGSLGVGVGAVKKNWAKVNVFATEMGPAGWYKALHFTREAHSAITLTHSKKGGLLFGLHGRDQTFYWGYYDTKGKFQHYAMYLQRNGNLTIRGRLTQLSDMRLKTEIEEVKDGVLDRLSNLKVVRFKWKNIENSDKNIGFIAQNVKKNLPEIVATEKNKYLTLDYSGLVALTVKAIRELREEKDRQIAQLREEIKKRDRIIESLQRQLEEIKKMIKGVTR